MEYKEKNIVDFDLKDLFFYGLRKLWIIILCAAIVCGGAYYYTNKKFSPQYSSTAKLFIMNNETEGVVSANDINVSSSLAKDYSELICSTAVLDTVAKNLGFAGTGASLVPSVTVTNPLNTRFLYVTVKYSDQETATKIANEICAVVHMKITELMGSEQVTIVESGRGSYTAVNDTRQTKTFLAAAIAVVISGCVIVLFYFLDDRIRSAEDVERYLGVNILGTIPHTKKNTARK